MVVVMETRSMDSQRLHQILELALDNDLITRAQDADVRRAQEELGRLGLDLPFDELLRRKEVLSEQQIKDLLLIAGQHGLRPPPEKSREQQELSQIRRLSGERIGEKVVKYRLIAPEKIDECLNLQERAKSVGVNLLLGEILVKRGYVTAEVMEALARVHTKIRVKPGAAPAPEGSTPAPRIPRRPAVAGIAVAVAAACGGLALYYAFAGAPAKEQDLLRIEQGLGELRRAVDRRPAAAAQPTAAGAPVPSRPAPPAGSPQEAELRAQIDRFVEAMRKKEREETIYRMRDDLLPHAAVVASVLTRRIRETADLETRKAAAIAILRLEHPAGNDAVRDLVRKLPPDAFRDFLDENLQALQAGPPGAVLDR